MPVRRPPWKWIFWLVAASVLTPAMADIAGTAGEPPPQTVDDVQQGHHEVPGDEPARPGARQTSPRLSWAQLTRNGFTSVQVNVDAFGDNIVGDAANEPSIAIDPTNPLRMAIGWRQFDSVQSDFREAGWAYSQDGGQTWTFPGAVEENSFRSDPVLDFDAEGNFYFYSLTTGMLCDMFKSSDGGQTWGPPVPAFGGDKEWMTVDRTAGIGRGNLYGTWRIVGPYGMDQFTRSTDGGLSFDGPFDPPGTIGIGTLTVGPDGTLYLAGVDERADDKPFVVLRSTDAQDAFSTPTFARREVDLGGEFYWPIGGGPNPEGLLGQVWIASDHSNGPTHGNLYLISLVVPWGAGGTGLYFVRSTDGGQTWSAPLRIRGPATSYVTVQWFPALAVAPNGRIDVIWNEGWARADDWLAAVYYSYSNDAGQTWSPSIPVTPVFNSLVGWPQQAKLGDYYEIISDDATANLAYAATFNGEQDIYFVRLGDCNGNGLHDSADIAGGTSSDCNSNGLPDECELAEHDCNTNEVPDDCDIAAGTSADCNENGIPDECDVATGVSPDCNTNGTPDECDVLAGSSADCNENGVPDECDIRDGTSSNCNGNAVPDECELAGFDCNTNEIPDDCDIAAGTSLDCNTNALPDECDLGGYVLDRSPCFSPLGDGFNHVHVIAAPRLALAGQQVRLAFDASGDLSFSSENVDVYLNGVWMDEVFGAGVVTYDCPTAEPDHDEALLTADDWNTAAATGVVEIMLVPSARVDADACPSGSWIRFVVSYPAAPLSADCNTNAIPDECDVAAGTSTDTNDNDVPDECETCRGDCDGDGDVDNVDIAYFVAALGGFQTWADYHVTKTGMQPPCPWANCDVNGDGAVNFLDIVPLANAIGKGCAR